MTNEELTRWMLNRLSFLKKSLLKANKQRLREKIAHENIKKKLGTTEQFLSVWERIDKEGLI